jgi:hypothetical protein
MREKKIGHLELTVIVLVPDEEGMVRHLPQVHQHSDSGLTLFLTLLQLYTTRAGYYSTSMLFFTKAPYGTYIKNVLKSSLQLFYIQKRCISRFVAETKLIYRLVCR